jgi:hypothetical protein
VTQEEAGVNADSTAMIMAELRALRTEVNGRFDGMNVRIDGMAVRIDDMASRNDAQHARTAEQLASMDEKITNIESETKMLTTEVRGARLLSETNASDLAQQTVRLDQHVNAHDVADSFKAGGDDARAKLLSPFKRMLDEAPKLAIAAIAVGAGGAGYLIGLLT